jgi:hypothetical protein
MVVAGPREAWETVAVPSDPAVDARACPAKREGSEEPSEPFQARQFAQHGGPTRKSYMPGTVRGSNMHFRIESFAWEGRPSSDGGIVVIEELEARIPVERLDARPHCLAQRAGAIHED